MNPWKMTRDEYIRTPNEEIQHTALRFDNLSPEVQKTAEKLFFVQTGGAIDQYDKAEFYFDKDTGEVTGDDVGHYDEVRRALRRGDNVPARVLADYLT